MFDWGYGYSTREVHIITLVYIFAGCLVMPLFQICLFLRVFKIFLYYFDNKALRGIL